MGQRKRLRHTGTLIPIVTRPLFSFGTILSIVIHDPVSTRNLTFLLDLPYDFLQCLILRDTLASSNPVQRLTERERWGEVKDVVGGMVLPVALRT